MPDSNSELDPRRLRDLLGRFTTGVAIVTSHAANGEHIGMTMSSFNSVSLAPPLVLFSVDREALGLAGMRESAHYAINVLSRDQLSLATRFGRSASDKWDGIRFTPGLDGVRLLDGALAYLECARYAVHNGGDHEIFVVEVLRASVGTGLEPLVFYRGRLRGLGEEFKDVPDWHLAYYYSR